MIAQQEEKPTKLQKFVTYFLPIAVTLLSIIATITLSFEIDRERQNKLESLTQQELQLITNSVHDNVDSAVIALLRMGQRWSKRGGTPISEWREDAKNYVEDFAALTTVQWADSTYHIKWIEPLKGNEQALGLNILFNEERKKALEGAIAKKKITITPPLDLVQGHRAFITYSPVYIDDKFDGFITGIFDLRVFLDSIISEHTRHNFHILIQDQDASVYASGTVQENTSLGIKRHQIKLFNRDWEISIAPNEVFIERYESSLALIALIVGIFISLLLGGIFHYGIHYYRQLGVVRHTSEELKGSKVELEAAINASPNGLLGVSAAGMIVLVNSVLTKTFGYTSEEMIGQPLEILVPIEIRDRHKEYFKTFLNNQQTRPMGLGLVLEGRRKDGSTFPVEIGLNPVHGTGELAILASVTDITERVHVDTLKRRAQYAVDNAADMILFLSPNGEVEYANALTAKKLGYSKEAVESLSITDIDRYYSENSWHKDWERLKEQQSFENTSTYQRSDGTVFECEVRNTYVEFEGNPLVIKFMRDISEEKRRAAYRSVLFNKSSNPHFIYNEQGIIDCNEAAVSILGVENRDALIGMHPAAFSPEYQPDGISSEDKKKEFEEIILRDGFLRFEWMHKTFSGEELPCEVTVSVIDSNKGKELLVVWTDLRRAKEHEKERTELLHSLETANHLLTQSNDDLEQFAYIASHDLKAPLRGIRKVVGWISEDSETTLSEESQ